MASDSTFQAQPSPVRHRGPWPPGWVYAITLAAVAGVIAIKRVPDAAGEPRSEERPWPEDPAITAPLRGWLKSQPSAAEGGDGARPDPLREGIAKQCPCQLY